MKLLFWVCSLLIFYAYAGYPVWLFLEKSLRPRAVRRGRIYPLVSIVISVRNGEAYLPDKIMNLRELDYPSEQLQVIVVSDGSTDRTVELLQQDYPFVEPVILDTAQGKASALNEAVRRARGDVLFFMDVRQKIERDALLELVSCFADDEVGAVSGELILERGPGEGVGIYWAIEKVTRKLESASGSVVGVTGAIYALRRELYRELPAGTILDDVLVPMNAARAGKRVIFQPTAIARDRISQDKGKEFSRKVRTLTGNYQLVRLYPWLISWKNPLLFRFVSHKLMRLPVPGLLVVILVASGFSSGEFYRAVFWLQIVFYALALAGTLLPAAKQLKPIAVANTFVMLNAAAAMAFYNFIRGRNDVWAS
jgi:poly-beta-1,6-N-acetyl-D-glucosamine synthase